jgi:pSer/pThr/pTyr-binding forkhead associated (FHA) protein
VTEEEHEQAKITGTLVVPASGHGQATLYITSGPQEGAEIPLITPMVKIGRATQRATWDISLQDRAVSRPHCEIKIGDDEPGRSPISAA